MKQLFVHWNDAHPYWQLTSQKTKCRLFFIHIVTFMQADWDPADTETDAESDTDQILTDQVKKKYKKNI